MTTIPQNNVRSKGAASKQQCAVHYVTEMRQAIEKRAQDPAYEGSERAEKDQRWLQHLMDKAGIKEETEKPKKSINPLKASKRMK